VGLGLSGRNIVEVKITVHAMFMASGDPLKAAFFRHDTIESARIGRYPIFMGCCGARPWPKYISRRLR